MEHNLPGRKRNADEAGLEEPGPPPITVGDYEVVCSRDNRLGKGGFGCVFRGNNTQSGDEVAVKIIEKTTKTQRFIERELAYMQDCSHDNIVKFFTSEERGYDVYIIMELCVNGNLSEYIESHTVSDGNCARFFANIGAGIQYLHAEKRLCHRDLKPENILVDGNETLKIADLGLAREFFLSSSAISGTGVGTFGWLAPEVLGDTDDRSKFSFASDIFSLGLLFLAILLALPGRKKVVPFTVNRVPLAQWLQAREGVLPRIPLPDVNSMRGRFKSIIIRMLAYAAGNRCKIHDVTKAIKEIQNAMVEEFHVRKVADTCVPFRGQHNSMFGSSNDLITGMQDSWKILICSITPGSVIIASQHLIPIHHKYDCIKHISPSGEVFLQSNPAVVTVYSSDMSPIRTLRSRGLILALLPGGQYAVVDNPASTNAPRRLTVAPVADLTDTHHHLERPPSGAHARDDELGACGLENGQLAVTVTQQRCLDFYGPTGEYLRRVQLPSEPEYPSCSATHVLVPLRYQPRICVLKWSGELVRILDHTQLGLHNYNHGYKVSPVLDGKFHFLVSSKEDKSEIHTYQIE